MTDYYIAIEPWAVYVKEGNFFRDQVAQSPSTDSTWHMNWINVEAQSIEHARELGKKIKDDREKGGAISVAMKFKAGEMFDEAIELWGDEVTHGAAMEEAAEFIQQLAKASIGKIPMDDPSIVEEFADNIITGLQYIHHYSDMDTLHRWIDHKWTKFSNKVFLAERTLPDFPKELPDNG